MWLVELIVSLVFWTNGFLLGMFYMARRNNDECDGWFVIDGEDEEVSVEEYPLPLFLENMVAFQRSLAAGADAPLAVALVNSADTIETALRGSQSSTPPAEPFQTD